MSPYREPAEMPEEKKMREPMTKATKALWFAVALSVYAIGVASAIDHAVVGQAVSTALIAVGLVWAMTLFVLGVD